MNHKGPKIKGGPTFSKDYTQNVLFIKLKTRNRCSIPINLTNLYGDLIN